MKIIKELEWDYHSLRFFHEWDINEEDDHRFKFILFEVYWSDCCITTVLFNFGFCCQWGFWGGRIK